MKFFAASLYLLSFIFIHSYGQLLPLTSHFIKRGHVAESMDQGVFAVHILENKSLVECALHCSMNLLCNAVDFCFPDGLYTCRFRYGHVNLSDTITQCEVYEITARNDCPDGLFLRAQGICKSNDECQNDPCLNGATCTNTPGSFNCTCDDGWTGTICNEDINECLNNPCQNGGNCTNNNGSFTCTCAHGWTGALCNQGLPYIALGKPVEQSSTYLSYGAEYAVDGNIIVDKCTNTADQDTNPWWRVDLQAVYSITSVRIFNRDVSDRLRNITVTVGRIESDVNTPCGFFAGPGYPSHLVVVDCPTLPQGRFVKISKTTEYLILCEVEVSGVSV